jgi:hypothetical protein
VTEAVIVRPGRLALHLEMAQMAPAAATCATDMAEPFEPAMLELRADRKVVRLSSRARRRRARAEVRAD